MAVFQGGPSRTDHLIGFDLALQVTHNLVNLDDDLGRIAFKALRINSRINQLPLARPIIAYAVWAMHLPNLTRLL